MRQLAVTVVFGLWCGVSSLSAMDYLRVSVKHVLDGNDFRSSGAYTSDASIEGAIDDANIVLANSGATYRLYLTEIVEISGLSQYYDMVVDDKDDLESLVQSSGIYGWREDSINFYLVNSLNAGGACSFPRTHAIIVINNQGILNNGAGWLHEVGHYLSLTHTFEACHLPEDDDPSVCTSSASSHTGNCGSIEDCADICDDQTNVMSYHGFPISAGILTPCQLGHMDFEIYDPGGSRGAVLFSPNILNDDCATPSPVGEGAVGGDLTFATNSAPSSCGDSSSNHDVWFSYVAPQNGELRLDTCGSNGAFDIDSVLAVYSACPATLGNELSCNDDAQGGECGAGFTQDSATAVDLQAGESVLIRVSHWGASDPGPFTLNVDFEPDMQLAPSITNILPQSGSTAGGTVVSISGQNFTPDAQVSFGLQPLSGVTFVNPQLITGITPPASSGAVTVSVSQSGGSDTSIGGFVYTENLLHFSPQTTSPGAVGVTVQAWADHDQPLAGFSFGVDVDSSLVTPTEVTLTGTAADGAGFFNGEVHPGPEPGGWFAVGVVMDLFGVVTIPAGNTTSIANLVFDVSPTAPPGFPILLTPTTNAGTVPVDICFVPASGSCSVPETAVGVIQVNDGSLFIRGDANGDTSVDIADAVATLGYLFSQGPADCLDALDTNDSGMVNIADAVYLLDALFTMGTNPPAPYPNEGVDPTADTLDCQF